MSLDNQDVKHIAKLARIRLQENEVESFKSELNQILDWVNMLQEVDTENVERMTSVESFDLPKRKDHVQDGNIQQQILQNAPKSDYGCFVVPKVVE